MTGFAEILANNYFGELNPKQSEYTRGILDAGGRLVSLIDDILDLSTIEAGYLSLNIEDVDVADLLQDVFDLTREWAGRETITATLKCPKDIGTIRADARRLKQVLVNLIRNAISFTPGGGSITLLAESGKENIRIAVADTGIGIRPDDQGAIFAPFQRANTTDAHGAPVGPGLGLSLVNNIVKLHGGEVNLTSRPGEGTVVTLILPRDGGER
jgi:signal transduction histidine kinase